MMAGSSPLKQTELTRYAKAMQAAGVANWRVQYIRPDGTCVAIIAGAPTEEEHGANPCDVLLK